jgi:tRNA (cmo5U34)-methyltransferase
MKKVFDFNDVSNFDDHIRDSIPNYNTLSETFHALTLEYLGDECTCVDLGCSTGRFLNSLPKLKGTNYIGVDINSFGDYVKEFTFVEDDVVDYLWKLDKADVIICMFTLQFLNKNRRKYALMQLQRLVNGGATLLLAEKVLIDDVRINHVLHKEHIHSKRSHFTDTEILQKERDLSGCMICKTESEMQQELKMFPKVTQVWQSYNFKAWCIY